MLKFSKTGNIVEVIEELIFFDKKKVLYWYYDVKNWRQSSFGKKGDSPDREMSDGAIQWVKKHYLPKII